MMYVNTGTKNELLYCHTNATHKTLGVMLTPNDKNIQQVNRMRKFVLKVGNKVHVGLMRGHDIFHVINSTVI